MVESWGLGLIELTCQVTLYRHSDFAEGLRLALMLGLNLG